MHGRAKLLSQFLSEKTKTLSCLHKGVHDHLTKLMFTDVTVAALLGPRSSDLHHTHVCAGSPQEAISFWKRQQDLLVFATHAYVCMRRPTTSCHHQTQCTKRKCSTQVSDLQNTLTRAGTSISARSTTISFQLLSLVLGARPKRPDLLPCVCVCALTSQQVLETNLTASGQETSRLRQACPAAHSSSTWS